VLYPLAGVRHDRLTRTRIENAFLVFDPEHAFEDDGELLELRLLARLDPATRTPHVGDADLIVFGVYSTDVLVDQLRLVAGGLDPSRLGDQCRHLLSLMTTV